jgi:hypothetical protein
MRMLELRQVSKVYGQGAAEVHALDRVSLQVDEGVAGLFPCAFSRCSFASECRKGGPGDDRFAVCPARWERTPAAA